MYKTEVEYILHPTDNRDNICFKFQANGGLRNISYNKLGHIHTYDIHPNIDGQQRFTHDTHASVSNALVSILPINFRRSLLWSFLYV